MQLASRRSSPDASCTLVQVQKRLGTSKSVQMTQKENGMNLHSKLRTCTLYRSIQSWKDVSLSRKENQRNGSANMHLHADDSSVKNDDGSQQISQRHLYCFSEYVIILERSMRSTLKVKEIRLRMSYSLREPDSASTSTLCSWKFLKLCFDSGGKLLSKGITFV